MFFVTLFLNEVIGWMRAQEGTGSLRAILYMDEIFGFFPPVSAPPSKAPMLTLLKQARAFGLGVVLATQNPVDLDYKGLANIGTWFLGRLQTERDRERLLDGLASASGGFDRKKDRRDPDVAFEARVPDAERARGRAGRFPDPMGALVSSRTADARAVEEARQRKRGRARGERSRARSGNRRRETDRSLVDRPVLSRLRRYAVSAGASRDDFRPLRRCFSGTRPLGARRAGSCLSTGRVASRIGRRESEPGAPAASEPEAGVEFADLPAGRRESEELSRLGEVA